MFAFITIVSLIAFNDLDARGLGFLYLFNDLRKKKRLT